MTMLKKGILGATAATALAFASASPAQAGDGVDGEDILAGVLMAGAAAAVIAAIADDDDDDGYYERDYDRDYRDRRYRGHRYGARGRHLSPRAAVRRCAAAAQRRASRYGRARVTEITDVDRERHGYEVEGRLVVEEDRYGRNRGYRYNARYDRRGGYGRYDLDRGRFSCDIRYGRITRLRVRGID